MKKNRAAGMIVLLIVTTIAVASCGGGSGGVGADISVLEDGTYHGESSKDDKGAYGDVTFTVADGKVTDCTYVTYEKDGGIKDEAYGKVNGEISNPDFYKKAQLAVDAMQTYADSLKNVQNSQDVDAISGATNSYNQFQEAVADAVD
jgi:major membrane immunogen (membrane-anchored lipoprotein)